MQKNRFRLNRQAALTATVAALFPVVAQAAPAARVDFSVGDVAAVNKAGQVRAVSKGAQIEEGETVNTNNGRAQLRFTDGAYVSLQPQSEFRIDQYVYEGKEDGSERTFLSLLKGGLRTITGFVGRTNKKNYQVSTTVATIGIRGTEYTIQYGESIKGTVGEGEIEVCNSKGCVNATSGESYYVAAQDVKPQLTDKRTDLPPEPPPPPPSLLREAECFDAAGVNCDIASSSGPPRQPLTGTQTLDITKTSFCGQVCRSSAPGVTVVFDSQGVVLDFAGIVPLSVQMSGNDGVIAWGTFTDSFGVLTHFVGGVPVPASDLANLAGSTGSYALISGTPVTDSSGATIGTLNSATMTIDFGFGTVGADMNWTIGGSALNATLAGSGQGSQFAASGSCGLSCSVSADIVLFGQNASRAGMTYDIVDFTARVPVQGIGAATFAQTGVTSTP
jgi:hypothetical protein